MNSTPLLADKGSLEMNPQDFRARYFRFVLVRDVSRDSFDRTQSLVGAGRDCGGDERCRAVFRDLTRDGPQSSGIALHNIMAAGSVDMHVQEAGNSGLVRCANFLC